MWKEVIREWGREVGEEEREVREGGGVWQGEGQKGMKVGGEGGGEGGRTYFDKPANKVTRYKHIHLVHYVCKGAIGVARSIDAAVLGIGALW